MTVDPSELNQTCSDDSTLEVSMLHILSFENVHKNKGVLLMRNLGGFFIAFHLGLIELKLPLLVMIFLAKSVVGTLKHLCLTLISLKSICKNIPPNISMIDEAKKKRVQFPSEGFFNFCKIYAWGRNVLGVCAMCS